MSEGIHSLAGALLALVGALFFLSAAVGLLRLPDFYSRTHAGGLTDTVGATFLLLGLALQAPSWIVCVKLLLIVVLLYVSSPTSTHALVKAAYSRGLRSEHPEGDRAA